MSQAAESFETQKIKCFCRRLWDSHRFKAVKNGLFNDSIKERAGERLGNPGKSLYFKLHTAGINDFNNEHDEDEVNYA